MIFFVTIYEKTKYLYKNRYIPLKYLDSISAKYEKVTDR